jgi:hypothetical protein
MSSGIKQCCAFGRHCVIANPRVGDRSCDDWTELTRLACWGKCLTTQCGEAACCQRQRRSGRADDEGSDLLLSSNRGARGLVVSKEVVAVGRKGGGGAWGGVDQPKCGAGRASPAKWSVAQYWQKRSQAAGRRTVGCNLVMQKMACSQSGCNNLRHFSVPPVRAIQGAQLTASQDRRESGRPSPHFSSPAAP